MSMTKYSSQEAYLSGDTHTHTHTKTQMILVTMVLSLRGGMLEDVRGSCFPSR